MAPEPGPSDSNDGADTPSQDGHLLAIETPLGKNVLLLTAIDGVAAVSRNFVYRTEVLTKASDDAVRSLLSKPVTLWLRNESTTDRRPLHGYVRHLTRLNIDRRGYRRWKIDVVPWLWFLTRSVDCRIYQNLSIPEILASLFAELDLNHYQFRLVRDYPKLEFCVQYRESAFDFVSRLMEHTGMFYWFDHQPDRHTMVITDTNQMAPFTQPRQAVESIRAEMGQIDPIVQDFAVPPGKFALNDFDFEVPSKNLRTTQSTILGTHPLSAFEVYDYPGHFTNADDGKHLTRLRIEEAEARHFQISGSGYCAGFDPGKRFELEPDRSVPGAVAATYFLTEIRHSARDAGYESDGKTTSSYRNEFVCIPAETPFRPERLTARPTVQGPQTATVVGPAGDNIHTDQYGRVRLLFHWDRRGQRDERASCWVRVSQQAAGSHWGGLAIPHVGQEVVVDFLEGDPDRPLVTGRVHNGAHLPPLNLPADKNKTIMRDHGDNKIIMHGKAGQQWMSMVTPRALNFVAMRSAAKPLSSGVSEFDQGLDQDAFTELSAMYTELAGLETTATSAPSATGSTFKTQINKDGATHPLTPNVTPTSLAAGDFVADSSDINTLSQGKINSMSLGNSNVWVGTDLNQQVVGDTTTESMGNVSNTYHNRVTDNFDTWHEENSDWHNEFTAFHTEVVGIHAEVTAAHIEATAAHIEQKELYHLVLNAAFGFHGNDGAHAENFLEKAEVAATKAEIVAESVKTIENELANYVTKTELTAATHTISAEEFEVSALQLVAMNANVVQFVAAAQFTVVCFVPGGIMIG